MSTPVAPPAFAVTDLPPHMQARIVTDDAGCWRWQVSHDRNGYGRCSLTVPGADRRRWSAHRLSWQLLVGPIPPGLHLDHLCRVRDCVNPAHLEPVTPTVNIRRSNAAAYWRAKTHCPRGHEYDAANTGRSTRGSRICRACAREKMRARRKSVRVSEDVLAAYIAERTLPARRTRGAA